MSTLKVDTISEKTASGGITFSQDITATLSSSSNVKAPLNATGSAPVYACRAWVNFNGTGTVAIRESGNVSSITDNGTGNYTVNFTTAMPDANYSVQTSGKNTSNGYMYLTIKGTSGDVATGSVKITGSNGDNGAADIETACVAVFR